MGSPRVITRDQHPVSRKLISPNAIKVLYRLKDGGYDAYLVGGCVRDILLGHAPKDFDVVTNATPEQVKKLFRNCRLIGRRFRLAHIVFGREIIEVATMRGHHSDDNSKISQASEHGQLLRDNVYGTIDEDAERRDFSINALYYSVKDFCIYDYANGLDAIERREVELIGDPETRYREDPVRMLRAVRFATKLDMTVAKDTADPIYELAHLLGHIPPARLFEECLKLFLAGKAVENYQMLKEFGLFAELFPALADELESDDSGEVDAFITQMFANTDERINLEKKVTPAFIFAALLWHPLERTAKRLNEEEGLNEYDAFQSAINQVISQNAQHVAVPKRFTLGMREIWQLQARLPKRSGQRAFRLTSQPRFKAAYDFLLLRAEISQDDDALKELASWWQAYLESDPNLQKNMVKSLGHEKGPKRRRSRRRYPKKKRPNNEPS